MMKRLGYIAVVLLLTGCTTVRYTHPTKSLQAQMGDEVECLAKAQMAAGDGWGLVHQIEVNRLYDKCLRSLGWTRSS